MTISYSDAFLKLLLRWKGSIWRMLWKELLIYMVAYYLIFLITSLTIQTDVQRSHYISVVKYFGTVSSYIDIQTLLGFYVMALVDRWWAQSTNLNMPQGYIMLMSRLFTGDENRLVRRTLARWANLGSILALRDQCTRMLKRFPTLLHTVKAGMATEQEYALLKKQDSVHGNWFIPFVWSCNLLKRCHTKGQISSPQLRSAMDELDLYKAQFDTLDTFDYLSLPLVYAQVAALATYCYFGISLVGRQVTGPGNYVPIGTIMEFLFYVGWLKVGQAIMNPFGEDDDDFETNYLLDVNIHNSFLVADASEVEGTDEIFPTIPLYTKAAMKKKEREPKGHLWNLKLKKAEMELYSNIQERVDQRLRELSPFQGVIQGMAKKNRDE